MYLKYNSSSDKCTLLMEPGNDWDFGYNVLKHFFAVYDGENARIGLLP